MSELFDSKDEECHACHGTGIHINYIIGLNSLDIDDADYELALKDAPRCQVCR